ncbi:MAG: glycosyltransferase family 2 protein [Lentisphaeria bacterium]|nr:glycosyltransferase family 2 protein [Lentisphaeria bacterium]
MSSDCCIEILLATYNSADFLAEQLESFLAQSDQNFRVLIHDGGSGDNTLDIIAGFCRNYPEKFVFLGQHRAKAMENFVWLLEHASAEIIMFSDHDDVWLPEKIAVSRAKLNSMQSGVSPELPLLVFTDSAVVDRDLKEVHPSMLKCQNLDPYCGVTLPRLLLQNVASGNTICFNRALKKLMLPVPECAVMHDHWAMLTAAAFGKIGFVPQATILYRQHGKNVLGAQKYGLRSLLSKQAGAAERLRKCLLQAAALYEKHRENLPPEYAAMLKEVSEFATLGFWRRRTLLCRYGIWKTGFMRNLALWFLV